MATCRYCERDISPNAARCPYCGDTDPHGSYYSPPDTRTPEAIKQEEEFGRYMMFAALPVLVCVFYGAIVGGRVGIGYLEKAKTDGLIDGLANLIIYAGGGLFFGIGVGLTAGAAVGYLLYYIANYITTRSTKSETR